MQCGYGIFNPWTVSRTIDTKCLSIPPCHASIPLSITNFLFGFIHSVDAIVRQGFAWMTMSNVSLRVKKPLTQIRLLVARQVGTARGSLTRRLGKFIIILKSQFFPECQSETADSIHFNSHCLSKMSQPNKFEIYRTSKECCSEHFPGSTSCIQDSIDSHPRFPWPIHFPGMSNYRPIGPPNAANNWGTDASHTVQWFPDLINKQNCVRGRNYEHWMQTDGFAGLYLFDNSTNCCKKW